MPGPSGNVSNIVAGVIPASSGATATPTTGPSAFDQIAGLGAGAVIGGIFGAILGSVVPGVGTAAGALAGASLGASIAGSVEGAQANVAAAASAAKEQADTQALQAQQLKAKQDLAEQQRQQQLAQLASNQAANLTQFQTEQGTALEAETGKLGQARQGLNEQIRQSGVQMLGEEAQAAQQGSAIAAAAASRGIVVGPGVSGGVTRAAEGGAPTGASGVPQLRAYEQATGQVVGAQKEQLATTQGMAFGAIGLEAKTFTEEQANALAGFRLSQTQQMSAAQLSETQAKESGSLSELQLSQTQTLQQQQTQANLASYDSSQWLTAFTSILGAGAQTIGKLYNPAPVAPPAYSLPPGVPSPYAGYSGGMSVNGSGASLLSPDYTYGLGGWGYGGY